MSARRALLIEIGCEEIPARMLEGAAADLGALVTGILERAELAHGDARTYYTPRRIAVLVHDVAMETPRREQTVLGPPASAAWNEAGEPQAPLLGFARKQGLEASAFTRVETERGVYAGARIEAGGRALGDVLAEHFASHVARLQFPKSMRWGTGEHRFVRPVHWLVALAGGELLALELFGVTSGRGTCGHRALAPDEQIVPDALRWEHVLMQAHVVADPVKRRALLVERLDAAAHAAGGAIVHDDALVDESNGIVEVPGVLVGAFEPRFAEKLPREVLRTCLAHHQKAFTIEAAEGLLPRFAVAVNVEGDPRGHVRRGHEWVVGGRLEDALFFWQEDRKRRLADRFEALSGVLVHKDLGTYAHKSRRVAALAVALAEMSGVPEAERAAIERAALLARCDLVSGLVGEFPELQGVVGGLLAREDGEPEPVWRAIYDLYRPAGADDALPATAAGMIVGLADRLDTLAGGFAVGLVPTGSKDPFALRRAGTGAFRLALALGTIDLRQAIDRALAGYSGGDLGPDLSAKAGAAREQLLAFVLERFAAWAERDGARYDEIAAVRAVAPRVPLVAADLQARLGALRAVRGGEDFLALALASKRVRNILSQAEARHDAPAAGPEAAALLTLPAERALADALSRAEDLAGAARARGDHEGALRTTAALRREVDRFFDEILVMDDDENIRRARLGLLARVHALAEATVDMSELVVEGHEKN